MTSSRPTFLTQTYDGYHHRDVPSEDIDLTHVGPGTPAGEYLRRFWQPIAHSDDLKDLPIRIRILCEDLVIFRDDTGRAGLLELHCCHRGTSLEYGKIENGGIRCCYHGWLFDISGKILETPGEPETSTLKDRLYHGAYPVQEYNGLVFAYMGPPEKIYPFPIYDAYTAPGMTLAVGTRNVKDCNWLQVMDNVVDPVHEAFLHARNSNVQFTDSEGRPIDALLDVGAFEVLESPIGLMCCVTRRIDGHIWSHNVEYIAPNIGHIPLPPTFHPNTTRARTRSVSTPPSSVGAFPRTTPQPWNSLSLALRKGGSMNTPTTPSSLLWPRTRVRPGLTKTGSASPPTTTLRWASAKSPSTTLNTSPPPTRA